MRTDVVITRGAWRGRAGTIAGSIEDRRARGITKALVRVDGELPDLYPIDSLRADDQPGLFGNDAPRANWPARPNRFRDRAGADRPLAAVWRLDA